MSYTTTEYLDAVKVRGMIPTTQNTFTTARLLALGDQAIQSYLVPRILKSKQGYYEYDIDTALNSTGVYNISRRAMGGKLINASLILGTTKEDCDWIDEDNLFETDKSPTGRPSIYLKRNQVILVPPATGHTYFRQTIPLRPGILVATSSAAQIVSINTGTKTLTFTSGTIPSTFTSSLTYDLIQDKPHFDHLAIDQIVTSVTSTTMVFQDTLPERLAVGDWVSIAEQSPVVQIPVELQPLLYQKVSNTCLRSHGFNQKADNGEKELADMEREVWPAYISRIEKEGKKLVPRNGLLRRQ